MSKGLTMVLHDTLCHHHTPTLLLPWLHSTLSSETVSTLPSRSNRQKFSFEFNLTTTGRSCGKKDQSCGHPVVSICLMHPHYWQLVVQPDGRVKMALQSMAAISPSTFWKQKVIATRCTMFTQQMRHMNAINWRICRLEGGNSVFGCLYNMLASFTIIPST